MYFHQQELLQHSKTKRKHWRKRKRMSFLTRKGGKTQQKHLVKMQMENFDYANADGKYGGDWQQPAWLSLRANHILKMWCSSIMGLQRQWVRKRCAKASIWICANHLMLSCTTSLSLTGETWIWPIQHSVDKELADGCTQKNCDQQFNIQEKTSHKRCPSGVSTGTITV